MRHCNHKNKQHTFQGELDILRCIKIEDHEGLHQGFARKLGTAISDATKYPDAETLEVEGITYLVEEELVSWGNEEGKALK